MAPPRALSFAIDRIRVPNPFFSSNVGISRQSYAHRLEWQSLQVPLSSSTWVRQQSWTVTSVSSLPYGIEEFLF